MKPLAFQIDSEPAKRNRVHQRGVAHAGAGGALLITAIIGLRADVAWIAQPFYAWAWWGYILLLDGYSAWKRGDSLLTTRRRFFAPICVWSVAFWFFFELINARIQNWYYVGAFPLEAWLAGAAFTLAAFATVFMGIFQTMDALNASGLWREWRGARRHFPQRLTYGLQAIGAVMGALALLFPHYLAPLVWGSFTLLVDPWNYRRGARSLLRDLEDGNFGLLARLLLAGLICGVVWESLNFFAPQKWIYTVRGLEGLKIFEMPLIGFLGFPALALDSMAAFAMLSSWLLGNQTWERAEDLSYEPALRPQRPRATFWTVAAGQALFCVLVSAFATPINIASLQVELRDLEMTPWEVAQLHQRGLTRPRQFIRATDAAAQRDELRQAFGWSEARLQELRQRASLYTFKGIGRLHGSMLERVGIRSPDDLEAWEPEALLARLEALNPHQASRWLARPRLDFARAWILAARDRGILQTKGSVPTIVENGRHGGGR